MRRRSGGLTQRALPPALHARCAGCADIDPARWAILAHLKVGQAVALPITEESGGELRLLTIAFRLTPHVRPREKYGRYDLAEGELETIQTGSV